VLARDNYFGYAWNSLFTSVVSTAIGLLIAMPAAYSMAFFPTGGTIGLLMWMLSRARCPAWAP
jgi:sorbitol/mannitol transport system permease protein